MKKYFKNSYILYAVLIMLVQLFPTVYRFVWFDEALTIFTVNQHDNLFDIYRNYIIPNNQIVYSWVLFLWAKLNIFNVSYGIFLRYLSLIFSVAILGVFYFRFVKRFKCVEDKFLFVPLLVMISILMSTSFSIYAGAIRGYQLSMLLILIVVDLQYSIVESVNLKKVIAYLILSMLALGTIPTNLLGIGMGVVLVSPKLINSKDWLKKLLILAILPFIALVLFYLPIWSNFINVCKLGEGINERLNVYLVVLLSFFSSSIVLFILAVIGFIKGYKEKSINKFELIAYLLTFIIPILPCLVLAKAPFYRVFYPTFIIWYIILGIGVKEFFNFFVTKELNKKFFCTIMGLVIAIVLSSSIANNDKVKSWISQNCVKSQDDLFSPYYLSDEFQVRELLKELENISGRSNKIYFSFNSDPIAFQYYLVVENNPIYNKFGCNVGTNSVKNLFDNDLIVVKKGEIVTSDSDKVEFLKSIGMWDIYIVKGYLSEFIR